MTLGWDAERQEVTVTEEFDTRLAPHSRALAAARAGTYGDEPSTDYQWNPSLDYRSGSTHSLPDRLTQTSPDTPARFVDRTTYSMERRSGLQVVTVTVFMSDALKGPRIGEPTAGVVRLRAPGWEFDAATGPVDAQAPDTVEWHVTARTQEVTATLRRQLSAGGPPMERHQGRSEIVLALALGVAGLALAAAGVVGRLLPARVRRRWQAAVWGAAVATVALAAVPHRPPSLWLLTSIGYRPRPEDIWIPGPLLGLWLWCLLPLLAWWLVRRLATGRRPAWPALAAGCLTPAAAIGMPLLDGTRLLPWAWEVIAVTAASCAGVALLPLLLRRGSVYRRWAPTAGALAWTAVMLWLLRHTWALDITEWAPIRREVLAALLTWPSAAFLAALLPPVLGRPVPRHWQAAACGVLWAVLWAPYALTYTGYVSSVGELLSSVAFTPYTGYSGYPFLVVALAGLVLVVVYLVRTRAGGRIAWPCGGVLMVWAAACAYGNPSLRSLSSWGSALAVLWAAVSWYVVAPAAAWPRTRALRRVSRAAHARLVGWWIGTRLVFESRADFQRAARSALSAGELTRDQFAARWRALEVTGSGADPADRLARARRAALGSAAGTSPGRAGLIGAALAQCLALPWAVYKLAGHQTLGADLVMPLGLREAAPALRFAHWAVFGFVFGCFYPALRGTTPVAKAAALLLAVVPVEVLPMAMLTLDPQYASDPSWRALAVGCAGAAGQSFVMCVGMGLVWEARLAWAAGVAWGQVRDFRRISSVTLPAGTVLVAAATAFATAVAGTWAEQTILPPPDPAATSTVGPPAAGP